LRLAARSGAIILIALQRE